MKVLALLCLLAGCASSIHTPVWDTRAIVFNRPIKVYVNTVDYPDYMGVIDGAIDKWNYEIGCNALVRTSDDLTADATVHALDGTVCGTDSPEAGIPVGSGRGVSVTYYCKNGKVDVQTRRLDRLGMAYRVFLHELGHVLGLDHALYGPMTDNLRGGPTILNTWPTNDEVVALHQRFCGSNQ